MPNSGLMSAKRNKSRINAAFVVWDEELFYSKSGFMPPCDFIMPRAHPVMTNKICSTDGGYKMESKIEILSTINVEHSDDLYKIVDTLNRTLKRDNLMFYCARRRKSK